MATLNKLALVVIFLIFSSCSMMATKITPEQKKQFMSSVNKVKFKNAKSLPKSTNKSMKIKKGQWVLTLTTMKDGSDLTMVKTKIIAVKRNSVVIETETERASDNGKKSYAQISIDNYPLQSQLVYTPAEAEKVISNIKVTKMLTKGSDGKVNEIPSQVLMISGNIGSTMVKQSVTAGNIMKSACKTQYLKSSRCLSYPVEVKIMGFSNKADVIVHSSIPINGQVQMEDKNSVVETIAYGTGGVSSNF